MSLTGFGSTGELAARVATLLMVDVDVTVATSCSVAEAPLARLPTVQIPVAGLKEPWLGIAETNVKPVGRMSTILTAEAGSTPLLVTFKV